MYQVCGLGNALVDTEVEIEDSFLRTHGIAKGHMTLIDGEQMEALTAALAELPKKRARVSVWFSTLPAATGG